jgi:hypothetical protein
MASARRVLATAATLAIFAAAFVSTHRQWIPTQRLLASHDAYQPAAAIKGGTELVVVYIGSARCAWSNRPELPGALERIKLLTQAKANHRALRFVSLGVSKDVLVRDGLKHLAKFGGFDEIATGHGVLNAAMLKYVFQDIRGVPATPQVLVTARISDYYKTTPAIRNEQLLIRRVGLAEILEWERDGAPIPTLPSVAEPRRSDQDIAR